MSAAATEAPAKGVETTKTQPAEPKDTRTPEQLEADRKAFEESWWSNDKPKKAEAKPAAEPPKAETTPPAGDAKPAAGEKKEGESELETLASETPPAAETKPTPAAPTAPAIDPEEITTKIIEGVSGALKPEPAAAPVTPVDPDANLSEVDRRQLQVRKHLETINPQYKGIADRTREFFKRESDYKANWLKENPNETFDPESSEHDEFYRKFEPNVSESVLRNAEISLGVQEALPGAIQKAVDEKLAPINERAQNAERNALVVQIEPQVQAASADAAASLISQALPELKDDLKDGLTKTAVAKIKKDDPEAFRLVEQQMVSIRGQVQECERMVLMGDLYRPVNESDLQKVNQVFYEMEVAEAGKPREKRETREGKQWVPMEFLSQAIQQANGDKAKIAKINSRFFTFDERDVSKEIVRRAAQNVSDVLDIAKKRVERVTKNAGSTTATATPPPTDSGQQRQAATPAPSITSSSDNVDTKLPGSVTVLSDKEKVLKDWW